MNDARWTPDRLKEEAIRAYATHGYKPQRYKTCSRELDGTICACGLGAILLARGAEPESIAADLWSCCERVAGLSFSNVADYMDGFDDTGLPARAAYPYVVAGRETWDAVKPQSEVS